MATVSININSNSYTEVLTGSGFCYSHDEVQYLFSDTEPLGTVVGMTLPIRAQMNGNANQTLWGKLAYKSVYKTTSIVMSTSEI
jgi:hypothetical protein